MNDGNGVWGACDVLTEERPYGVLPWEVQWMRSSRSSSTTTTTIPTVRD